MTKTRLKTLLRPAFFSACALLLATSVRAQEIQGLPSVSPLAAQTLRPYWHVFAAYTIVIILIGGWAISIARRLRGIEDRLED